MRHREAIAWHRRALNRDHRDAVRHGEQRSLVRGGQVGPRHSRADCLADTEFLPQPAGSQDNTQFENGLDVDLRQRALLARWRGFTGIAVNDTVDAGDQALQSGFVELVGAAEAVHHAGLRAPSLGVPDVLGQGVLGDGGAVAVPPLGDPQIHAHTVGMYHAPANMGPTKSCV